MIAKYTEKNRHLIFLMEILKNNSKAGDKAGMVKAEGVYTRMDKPAGKGGRAQSPGNQVPLTSEHRLAPGSPGTGPRAPRGQDLCGAAAPTFLWLFEPSD